MEAISSDIAIARLNAILLGQPQQQPTPSSEPQQPAQIVAIPSRRRGKRLSDAVEAYCKENQHSWTAKTGREFSGIYERILGKRQLEPS